MPSAVSARALALLLTCAPLGACRDGQSLAPAQGTAAQQQSVAFAPSASSPSASATSAPTKDLRLGPLRGVDWLEPLDLGDGDVAFVAAPVGATEPRPLVVAVHGAHDRPEWACGGWRLGFSEYPFVVCPRGVPVSRDKFAWSSSAAMARVVKKAVAHVRQRFDAYVAPGPDVFAAFSQGATLAEPFVSESAASFPTLILAEGGYDTLSSPRFAERFAKGGGKTVVVVCGTPGCRTRTSSARRVLESAALRVFESGDVRSGHNLNSAMQAALRRDHSHWFVGDPRWGSAAETSKPGD